MKNLFEQFAKVKGAKFIGINNYVATSNRVKPETANYVINTNINEMNAKKKDLETLKKFPASQLLEIAKKCGASKEEAMKAVEELIVSKEKNLSTNIEERTNQSKGQTDAYTQLGKGLKFHNETGVLYVTGLVQSKKVIIEGEYKKVNSAPKTLVKKAIERTLRMSKYRTFKISQSKDISVSGGTAQ
jgi:hypothetical protein